LTDSFVIWSQDHSASQTVTISITGTNDAPVLTDSGPAFAVITEDDTNQPGRTVAEVLNGTVTDVDANAAQGIAITGAVSDHGHWQFSIDGGATWTDFGSYSTGSALLLAANDLIRFHPDGENRSFDNFTFVAWDQTSGTHGDTADVGTRGG